MSLKALLVSGSRLFKRAINPVGFIARSFIQQSSRHLPPTASSRSCVDIGAGTAPYESTLQAFAKVEPYIAVDVAPSDKTTVIADCGSLPLRADSIDLVVSFDVIQHVTDPRKMLTEARRVLKPGGHLILTYPFLYPECDAQDFRRWTVDGMRSMLNAHGFEMVLEQRRGGALFAWTCWITWMIQHLIPGQRRSWRASRGWISFVRAGVLAILTLPAQLLGWVALMIDSMLPSRGIYMGACVMARKTHDTDHEECAR